MKQKFIFFLAIVMIILGLSVSNGALAQVGSCLEGQTKCPADCILGINCTSCQPNSGSCATGANYSPCGGCACSVSQVACTAGGDLVAASNTSATCRAPATSASCDAGGGPGSGTINVCGACRANSPRYVSRQYSFGAPESGFINITGDIGSGGDIYLNSGKAIQVSNMGGLPTLLNIGNWGGGVSGVTITDTLTGETILEPNLAISLNLFGELNIRSWGDNIDNKGKLTVDEICLGTNCHTAWPSSSSLILEGAGGITINGSITATGCFGPVFVGVTSGAFDGGRDGYSNVHTECRRPGEPGGHACSSSEILNSIACGSLAIMQEEEGTTAWIMSGPPVSLTQANDCSGWVNNTDAYGTIWEFGRDGGKGFLSGCNVPRKFACCK